MRALEEIIAEEKKRYRAADKELNAEYKKLYAGLDGAGRGKLIRAQRKRIAFRCANAVLRRQYERGKTLARAATSGESELRLHTALWKMTEVRPTELAAIRQEREAAAKR